MNHLTAEMIFDLVDDRLEEKRKRELEAHLGKCDRCRRAVALERSMNHVIRNAPLIKAPASLSAFIMVKLSARTIDSLAMRILGKLGSLAAMALVLGVIGFAITSVSDVKTKSEETSLYVTRLTTPVTEMYAKSIKAFTHQTSAITQTIESTSRPRFWNTVFTVLVIFGVLGAADKMFGKRLTKLRS